MTLTPLPSHRLHGLAPILDADTRLIVLGSFPSRASLQAQRYYAHPQNQFWKILGALWGLPLQDMNYQQRTDALRAHGLGVWDVYASCEREGSLDSARQLRQLFATLPPEALVLETDAPDMPPCWLYVNAAWRAAGQPQGRNSPAELPRIAAELAGLRGLTPAALADLSTANALAALHRLAGLLT